MAYRFKNNYYISTTCECGATRHVKDHGSWVGYYCPTCKQGGSVSKKRKFNKKASYQRPTFVTKESFTPEVDEPMGLVEHCRIESGGLEGQALKNYINRYYGHG